LRAIHPLLLAFIAGCFTFAMTAAGAAAILLRRNPSQRMMDSLLGFSAGVMLAAIVGFTLMTVLDIALG
jgi:ZIP family zinc transporter